MNDKEYEGYSSYQYLDPGKDYKEFDLAEEINRPQAEPGGFLGKLYKERSPCVETYYQVNKFEKREVFT